MVQREAHAIVPTGRVTVKSVRPRSGSGRRAARGASVPGSDGFPPSIVGKMSSIPVILHTGPAAHADSRQTLGDESPP